MAKQILIIEDDFETQFLFSELLRDEGFDVVPATTGKEALESIKGGQTPDLIFMDLNFPGGTPEEFAQSLRDNPSTKNTPIVIISGKSDIEDYATRLNAAGFVKKPFELDPLLVLIQNVL